MIMWALRSLTLFNGPKLFRKVDFDIYKNSHESSTWCNAFR